MAERVGEVRCGVFGYFKRLRCCPRRGMDAVLRKSGGEDGTRRARVRRMVGVAATKAHSVFPRERPEVLQRQVVSRRSG